MEQWLPTGIHAASGLVAGLVLVAFLTRRGPWMIAATAWLTVFAFQWRLSGLESAVAMVARQLAEAVGFVLRFPTAAAGLTAGLAIGVAVWHRARRRKVAAVVASAAATPPTHRRALRPVDFLAIMLGVAVAAVAVWFIGVGSTMPTAEDLRRLLTRPQVVVDADLLRSGDRAAFLAAVRCRCPTPVPGSAIPNHLKLALVAAEDRRFFQHRGVDLRALGRAFLANFKKGFGAEGASTIEQQLAKNLVVGDDSSFPGGLWRKLREVHVAGGLDNVFTKEEILDLYLNQADFGASDGWSAYGAEQAALKYFGKPARRLNLYEAAMLVGALRATAPNNPARNPVNAAKAARRVLARMVEAGFITRDAADAAIATGIERGTAPAGRIDPYYFLDFAYDELRTIAVRTAATGTIRFVLTLAPDAQRAAEATMRAALVEGAARRVGEAALLSMTPDGDVVAIVGGGGSQRTQFNRAVRALRQPGSAFKLFGYISALEHGFHPGSRVLDAPNQNSWPRNFSGPHRGWVTLEQSATGSLNGAAVWLARKVGIDAVADAARRLGIRSPLVENAALALGASEVTMLDLTAAYAVVANGGRLISPRAVTVALDSWGQVIYRAPAGPGRRVIAAGVAEAARSLLRSVVVRGTGRAAQLHGTAAAGKTGTTDAYRDAWFVGFTERLVTAVWMGNDDASSMLGVTGGDLPAQAWRGYNEALRGRSFVARPPGAALAW